MLIDIYLHTFIYRTYQILTTLIFFYPKDIYIDIDLDDNKMRIILYYSFYILILNI
jgi:hypothetical protein